MISNPEAATELISGAVRATAVRPVFASAWAIAFCGSSEEVGAMGTAGACDHSGAEGANFCPRCGAPLVRTAARRPDRKAHAPGGERRQLTVLFCDLVESADLGSRVDPEVFHDIVDAYYNICGEAIAHCDGHIANYLGDGIVALFGYPQAYEDSADNAVRAALELQAAIASGSRAELMHGETIAARVGIHTGLVVVNVVGSAERREIHALGDAVNIAARVQGVANAGSVIITDATRRLLRTPFAFTDRGLAQLKGITDAIALSQVDLVSADHNDLSITARAAIPFVGRTSERAHIAACWQNARLGSGRVVLVRGEPGIGKSRLVAQSRIDIGDDDHRWIAVQASRMLQHSAFTLIRDLIKRMLDWGPDTSPEQGRVLLDNSLTGAPGVAEDAHYLLRDLLGVLTEHDVAPVVSKEQMRKRAIDAYVSWIREHVRDRCTVVVVEDMQWADPSSIEVLNECVEAIAETPVLALLTTRPEFLSSWTDDEHRSTLSLQRLDPDEAREIIRHSIVYANRTADLVEELAGRSDGVPLFAEELALTYADSAGVLAATIPATLYDSLMARLDRLPTAKPLAQLAAVFGRDFSAGALLRVSGYPRDEFDAALGELVHADLVAVERYAADTRCEFKHALVQQAAYDSLLHRRRTEIHRSIADMMLSEYDAATHPQLEVVARHLTEANETERAIDAWQQAADRAAATSANREALTLYESALGLLRRLPESDERTKREIKLLLSELGFHFVIEGPSGPNSLATLARARELSNSLPRDGHQHLEVIGNSVAFALSRGDLQTARELADDLTRAAEASGDQSNINQAHIPQAGVALNSCELQEAVRHAELALRQVGRPEHSLGTQFQRGFALLYGGVASCLLGGGEQATAWRDELVEIAMQDGDDPVASLMASVGASVIAVWHREYAPTMELASKIEEVGRLFDLDLLTGGGCIYGGWAEAVTGGGIDAAQRAQRGLGLHIEVRQQLGIAHSFALVAEAQFFAGAVGEGLATIDDALSQPDHRQLHHHTVELLRLRAVLRDVADDSAVLVEADLVESVGIAQAIGARLLELRSREQLARWLAQRGRAAEALATLEPIIATMDHLRSGVDIDTARATLVDLSRSATRSILT